MKKPVANEWYKLGPFTIFDVETTGMSPVYHRIVEIAAIKIGVDGEVEKFSSLINPNTSIPFSVSKIHGITNEMVMNKAGFDEVGGRFIDFAHGTALVAHNARFDLGFLQESLAREGLNLWNGKTMDTIPLIKQAYPGLKSYSLQYLRQVFNLKADVGPAHRAFADVEWTLEIFEMTMKKLLLSTTK
jgi:DNA polymerase III subunit epsilon